MRIAVLYVFILVLGFAFQAEAAEGINSTGSAPLPMGAGGSTFIYVTSTGQMLFGSDSSNPKAWVDSLNGTARFTGGMSIEGVNADGVGLSVTNNIKVGVDQIVGSAGNRFGFWNGKGGLMMDNAGDVEIIGNVVVGSDSSPAAVTVAKVTIPGTTANESLDVNKMNTIINISNLPACDWAAGEVMTKDGTNSYKCVKVSAGGSVYKGTIDCSSTGRVVIGFVNGEPKCGSI